MSQFALVVIRSLSLPLIIEEHLIHIPESVTAGPMSSSAPPCPETPAGSSSTKVQAERLVIAIEAPDSLAYAAALVNGGSAVGSEPESKESEPPHCETYVVIQDVVKIT